MTYPGTLPVGQIRRCLRTIRNSATLEKLIEVPLSKWMENDYIRTRVQEFDKHEWADYSCMADRQFSDLKKVFGLEAAVDAVRRIAREILQQRKEWESRTGSPPPAGIRLPPPTSANVPVERAEALLVEVDRMEDAWCSLPARLKAELEAVATTRKRYEQIEARLREALADLVGREAADRVVNEDASASEPATAGAL